MIDAAIITAIATALGCVGKFVWNKVEARFEVIETALDECREDRELSEQRRGILSTIIELMKQELTRHLPESPTLVQASELMKEYKSLTPKDN